jgi:DNA-binding MarR family transcriptional regulator
MARTEDRSIAATGVMMAIDSGLETDPARLAAPCAEFDGRARARSNGLSTLALTVHVNHLLIAGLLERTAHPDSFTTRRLYPTELSHTRTVTSLEHRRDRVADALGTLSEGDQRQIAAVLPCLDRLAGALMER